MAIPYYPNTYGYPAPFIPQQPQPQNQNGIIAAWVQGEQAMKSFALGPNQKAFLFNTEENNFGIKTTDSSGMPNPLEMYAYTRINPDNKQQPLSSEPAPTPAIDTSLFVTKEELDNRILELMVELENKGGNKHGK